MSKVTNETLNTITAKVTEECLMRLQILKIQKKFKTFPECVGFVLEKAMSKHKIEEIIIKE